MGAILTAAILWMPSPALAQGYRFSRFAGPLGGPGSTDGEASAARFNAPAGVAVGANGTTYVADRLNHTIRKVTAAGVVTTLAGSPGVPGAADGTGSAARFNGPRDIAVDPGGTLYVADSLNHTIRRVTPAGEVTTLAGSSGVAGATNATGSAARFREPEGVAVHPDGFLIVADTGNHALRAVTLAGAVTTYAGAPGSRGATDGPVASARFNEPTGVTVAADGTVYVADCVNHTIRVVAAAAVSTLAGSPGLRGAVDGTGAAARFEYPNGVAIDGSGALVVADEGNHTVRRVTVAGEVSTLAGLAGSSGSLDGTGAAARFANPTAIAGAGGLIVVSDTGNHTLRSVAATGATSTLAGVAGGMGITDGVGDEARFFRPSGIAVDAGGSVWVGDDGNKLVRRISAGGAVSTVAGAPGLSGSADGTGPAARFTGAQGVAASATGAYVADTWNSTLRHVSPNGQVTTLAGLANARGLTDGLGSAARFSYPYGVTTDATGVAYVADTYNNAIRKVEPDGTVSTLAPRFNVPTATAVDGAGNVYVVEATAHVIKKVTPGGAVTTVAGVAGAPGSADGIGPMARFNQPIGIAVDTAGVLYVTDLGNRTIRRVSSAGEVTTIGGVAGVLGSSDGVGAAARFNEPWGIAVDANGVVYVADRANNAVSKGVFVEASPPTLTSVFPSVGRVSGGTPVVVSGSGFAGGVTGVTFGGVPAGDLQVVNSTTITAVTPPGSAGATTVVVTTPGGMAALPDGFTYVPLPSFTDDPLVAGSTLVKAVHVTELRLRIDELRARAGLSAFAWTDAALAPATTVKAVHIAEMRQAMGAVASALGLEPPAYARPVVAGQSMVAAADVSELRLAVLAIW